MIWGYYVSPLMYGQNAIALNEFLDQRWNAASTVNSFHRIYSTYCYHHYLVNIIYNILRFFKQPNTDTRIDQPTIGKVLLKSRGLFLDGYMFWICIAALFAFSLVFNVLFILALTYLNRKIKLFLPTYLTTMIFYSTFDVLN